MSSTEQISFLVMALKWHMHRKSPFRSAKTKLLISTARVFSPKLGALATVVTEFSHLFSILLLDLEE